jgi:hypothetical protein
LIGFGAEAQPESQIRQQMPDFGIDPDTSWFPDRPDGDNFLAPLSGGPGPIMSPPEHPYRPNGEGDDAAGDPTSRVADLSNPILTQWARDRMQVWNDMVLIDQRIPFEAQERCFPPGVPAWNVFRRVGTPMSFMIQLPHKVLLIWHGDSHIRHIYLNVPHSQNPEPSWHGESVGHYEGNTLVVDTIALLAHEYSFVDNYRTPHSDRLHVVERFTLVAPDTLEINVHVEDPVAFATPWNARQSLTRTTTRGRIGEHRCAEGNPDFFNVYPVPVPEAEIPDF